jgi:hypothetical protein
VEIKDEMPRKIVNVSSRVIQICISDSDNPKGAYAIQTLFGTSLFVKSYQDDMPRKKKLVTNLDISRY